jgi:hypothetical protein
MSLGTDVSIPISPARCQIRPVQVKDEGVSINPAQLDFSTHVRKPPTFDPSLKVYESPVAF